jgi:hypothetical protein
MANKYDCTCIILQKVYVSSTTNPNSEDLLGRNRSHVNHEQRRATLVPGHENKGKQGELKIVFVSCIYMYKHVHVYTHTIILYMYMYKLELQVIQLHGQYNYFRGARESAWSQTMCIFGAALMQFEVIFTLCNK